MLVVLPMRMLAAGDLRRRLVIYIMGSCDHVATGHTCIKTVESLGWNALL